MAIYERYVVMAETEADFGKEDLWSCFTCNHLGECGEDENGEECCPNCGTHCGDGFGMAENDPRYRSDEHEFL